MKDLPDLIKDHLVDQHGGYCEIECLRCKETSEGFAGYSVVTPSRESAEEDMRKHYAKWHPGHAPALPGS